MSDSSMVLGLVIGVIMVTGFTNYLVTSFKMSYYKQKLLNAGIDTSHVDNMGILEVLFD